MATRQNELIAAIITPPGEGGIGAIRVAGDGARDFCLQFVRFAHGDQHQWEAFHMRYGEFCAPTHGQAGNGAGEALDEIMAVWMPDGKSYTGDEQVEIFCHGGQIVLRQILNTLVETGAARHAEPGEFTKRAFLAGRIDLAKAEAVAEMIAAKSEFAYQSARKNLFGAVSEEIQKLRAGLIGLIAQLEAYLDFPDEDIEPANLAALNAMAETVESRVAKLADTYRSGQILRDGFKMALCGRPNAGKSSLFNLLLRKNRAIVSAIPGTTRDFLTEWITLGGYAVALSDTAGLRSNSEEIEALGQQFTNEIARGADLILWLVDASDAQWRSRVPDDIPAEFRAKTRIVVNKIDAPSYQLSIKPSSQPSYKSGRNGESDPFASISCATQEGIPALEKSLGEHIHSLAPDQTDGVIITSARQAQKLSDAGSALARARAGLVSRLSPELIVFELRDALGSLDEITGRVYTDDILGELFAKFCVGK